MELEQNVDLQDEGYEAEDSLPEELTEEPQDDSISLEDALGEEDQEEPETEKTQSAGGQKEPGYVKRRIDQAVRKVREELTAQFEAQIAPFREYQVNVEAQELVRTGKVKDLETAKELVRYRQGQPQETKAADSSSQPRNERGQYTSGDNDKPNPVTQARIEMLQHQADRIKRNGGPDVIAAFNENEEVKKKLIMGEWDFEDVADFLKNGGGKKKRPPAPMRAPNGASGTTPNAFDSMSDEQFDRMEKKIKEGARYSLR